MTRHLLFLALILSGTTHADPGAMSDAFSQGTTFGTSNNAAIRSNIQSGAAQSALPGAPSTAPQASYFNTPGLTAPAASTISACAASTLNPNAYNDQACQAVNFSQTNPAVHPQFNLQPTDPIFANTKTILNDPAAIAGNIAGTYSGCTTQTTQSPDIYQTAVCNAYRTLEQPICSKTLIVTVTDNGLNCSYGSYLTPNPRIVLIRPFVFVGAICADDIRFQWIWGYSECDGTNAAIVTTTIVPSPDYQRLIVNLGCGGVYFLQGSCLNGTCNYTVGYPANGLSGRFARPDITLAGFSYTLPVHTFTITDAWNDQCAIYEARLP